MSSKIISYGATVERSADGGTTWENIPERTGIAVPTVEQDYTDATSLDSPNGFKEYLPGLKDLGEITLAGWYTADVYEQTIADETNGQPVMYRSTLKPQASQTSGDVFEFSGYPRASVTDNGLGEAVGLDVVIRTTGEVTYTRGS